MIIKGLDKFSLIDYPGKIAAIIFVAGCNFRCPYCHNPHLVLEHSVQPRISESTILSFLKSRTGKIDGVVVSGGEPTLQKKLPVFLRTVKELGFSTKIDTNGSNPEVLQQLFEDNLLDAVGIDYKAPPEKYELLTASNQENLHQKVIQSIRICLASNKMLEIKTTVHKKFLSPEDLYIMRSELDKINAKNWILQQFHHTELIDNSLNEIETYSDAELANFAKKLPNTRARGIKGIFFE